MDRTCALSTFLASLVWERMSRLSGAFSSVCVRRLALWSGAAALGGHTQQLHPGCGHPREGTPLPDAEVFCRFVSPAVK